MGFISHPIPEKLPNEFVRKLGIAHKGGLEFILPYRKPARELCYFFNYLDFPDYDPVEHFEYEMRRRNLEIGRDYSVCRYGKGVHLLSRVDSLEFLLREAENYDFKFRTIATFSRTA